MIQLFTASPVRFSQFDFNAVGSGTDVARHGFGMYFGTIDIALHYLSEYRDYTRADKTFYYNSNVIDKDSIPFEIATHIDTHGVDSAISFFSNSDLKKKFLSIMLNEKGEHQFSTERGVMYFVSIPHYDQSDLRDWDDSVNSDELTEIFNKFINTYLDTNSIPDNTRTILSELGVPLDDTNAESIIDALLELGFDDYIERMDEANEESEMISSSHYDLLDLWTHRAFGDYDYDPNHGDDEKDIDLIDSKYIDALTVFCALAPQLHNFEFSLGDTLTAVKHSISAIKPDLSEQEAEKQTSLFASKDLKIVGYTAPAKTGEHGSKEVVIICEHALKSAKIQEVSRYHGEDFDVDCDLNI